MKLKYPGDGNIAVGNIGCDQWIILTEAEFTLVRLIRPGNYEFHYIDRDKRRVYFPYANTEPSPVFSLFANLEEFSDRLYEYPEYTKEDHAGPPEKRRRQSMARWKLWNARRKRSELSGSKSSD